MAQLLADIFLWSIILYLAIYIVRRFINLIRYKAPDWHGLYGDEYLKHYGLRDKK